MATVRNLKIKTSTCKRILKELHSYEKEVEREAAKTVDMKEKGADPYDLKQQENVLAESRMMVPDCRKRLEGALEDLKGTLVMCNMLLPISASFNAFTLLGFPPLKLPPPHPREKLRTQNS
ncbi:hypothetical protein KY290_001844 [Solanum tuberosum]|uniref:Tubulin-specific chaperone A n=1 Tax=Solanum tuberosum TaxID=4113 RepID=A0ABQ7WNF9_SOLTU|nr:hypothetical protein KY290_001844 [Solanum tuberosum]